uniref:Uncharacterized protein n=1 Tax=Candidatus Kentrum sp. LFY TaxID=2126342 RepID=A0A450U836_9GAMM|nr:MAG: hypothetical protein BECKLFY1418B_GA0070995_10095 [Candidatus Kentron sp. LFY]
MQLSPVLFSILGPLAVPLIFWLHHNYKILLAAKTGDEEKDRRLANDRRASWIANRSFEERYRHFLGRFLDGLARLTRDTESIESSAARDSGVVRLFGIDPFTEDSYKLCLRLAFAYPLAGFFVAWALGSTGEVAGVELLAPLEAQWRRWLLLGSVLLFGWLYFNSLRTGGRSNRAYLIGAIVAVILGIGTAASAGIEAVVVVAIVACAIAFALRFTVAVAVAVTGTVVIAIIVTGVDTTGTGVGISAFVGIGAFAVAFFIDWPRKYLRSRKGVAGYWIGFNLFFIVYISVILAWAFHYVDPSNVMIFLLPVFLTLLPLANAALDWLSLGVTRGLLYAIHRGHHSGLLALGGAALDIVLALLFLFGIASLTTFVVAGLDAITLAWGGRDLLDLGALFGKLESSPWSLDVAWVHFMMLSTLVPTLVHFFIAGSAAVLILPDGWRDRILANFDRSDDARWWAFLYVSFVPPLAFVAPAALLWGLYHLITTHHGMIGGWLLDWARWVASVVDPSFSATQAGQWLVFWQGSG